jgi:hypothetical protein
MITTSVRRLLGIAVIALVTTVAAHAQALTYYGNTTINFSSVASQLGRSNFDVDVTCDWIPGGSVYCEGLVDFAGYYTTSYTYWGETGAHIYLSNVHFNGSSWVADTVMVYYLDPSATYWTTTYYYNVTLPSSSYANGYARLQNGQSSPIRTYIY